MLRHNPAELRSLVAYFLSAVNMPIKLTSQAEFQTARKQEFCYLCERVFKPGEVRNRDHVPTSALFAVADSQPALILPTHRACNHRRSAEDEVIGQLVGVLHGRPIAEHGRKPKLLPGRFADGSSGVGTSLQVNPIIFRWVRGFHAALYNEPLGPSKYKIFSPLPEMRITEKHAEPVPIPDEIPHFVDHLKRNRLTRTMDVVVCRNDRCLYESVWIQADNGRSFCIWGLDIYGWKELGDINHFEPRGCVGMYQPNSGVIPATATTGTHLCFDVAAVERLNPFGG